MGLSLWLEVASRFASVPLFVAVNRKTASAAEVLTAALQENKRAVVLGEKTFGKGIVQNVASLRGGTGVAVTVANYATPSGANLNKVGIAPDRALACEPLAQLEDCLSASGDARDLLRPI